MHLLKRKDLQPAIRWFEKSTRASREHSAGVNGAIATYGGQGPDISGVGRDHFPLHVKDKLRKLARQVGEFSDKAYAARPKGVRLETMHKLSTDVATKFGSGFYGPQGRRKNPASKRYFLYDVLNDYSIAKVDGKSDFGILSHAKRRGVKDNRGEKVIWTDADIPPRSHQHFYGRNKHKELIYLISTHGLLKNPKLRQKGNTTVTEGAGKEITVRLHDTDIVKVSADGKVQLNSGGWKTPTTKRRMNEAADELKLGFNVYAKKGEWFVESYEVGIIPFFDGMEFPAVKLKNPKRRKTMRKKKRSAKQLANDRRLGRMAKARAKAKRGGRKLVDPTKRKMTGAQRLRRSSKPLRYNPHKKKTTRSKPFWVVFRCKKASYGTGASVAWLGAGKSGVPLFGPMSRRFLFQALSAATDMAKKHSTAGFYVGVASKSTTSAMLMKYCMEKAKGK